MNQDSIFTKIIKGDIPCHKIYEDEKTFVFLDIYPIQPGQVLVVPKAQVQFVWQLESPDYQALMETAKNVALRIQMAFTQKTHVGMHIEGLDVDHAHIKLFPFSTDEEFHSQPDRSVEPDHTALAEMAQKLAFSH